VGRRWDGLPPEEAYGRVTDAGRIAGLHPAARELLHDLQLRFDVTRETSGEPDPHGSGPAPVVRLVPAEPAASCLTVVFTAFPGLLVRAGDGIVDVGLPPCGCDACAEPVESCVDELRGPAATITAGTIGARIVHEQGWWLERGIGAAEGLGSRTCLDGAGLDRMRALLPGGHRTWAPWPRRPAAEASGR
jgi:hypothetical protein